MWEFLPPPLFGNDMFVRKNYGLEKPSFMKKFFFCEITSWNGDLQHPPFMKSQFIFFVHFLSKKIDDFEGCLKGVDVRFKGVAGCLKCVWRVFGKIK